MPSELRNRMKARAPRRRPFVEELESRNAPAGNLFPDAIALPLDGGQAEATAVLSGSSSTTYAVTLPQQGRLAVDVRAAAGDTRLSLFGADGTTLLGQSDGQTPANRDDRLAQHLHAGERYYLRVESLTAGGAAFRLTAEFQPATAPFGALPVGGVPWGVAHADFNGDGAIDLAVANTAGDDVSVLLGVGDGTFAPERRFAAGEGAVNLTAADFDNDGVVDLVTGDFYGRTVSFLRGVGNGSFAAPVHLPAGPTPGTLAAGDFNGDKLTDFAVTNSGSANVTVYTSRLGGGFDHAGDFVIASGGLSLTTGDFDKDGRLDLAATASHAGAVSVLYGGGDGTFGDRVEVVSGFWPYAVTTADFNGDGSLDLVTANLGSSDVTVMLGVPADELNPRGGFLEPMSLTTGNGPVMVRAADFNGDGRIDLAVSNFADANLSVFLGYGDGTFDPALLVPTDTAPGASTVADFNGDRVLDLAVTSLGRTAVQVLLGRGDGTFRTEGRVVEARGPFTPVPGDFDNDGLLDFVTVNYVSRDVLLLVGRPDGTFVPHTRTTIGFDPVDGVAGDFNGDGLLDLATANLSGFTVSVLLGVGRGVFAEPVPYYVGAVPQAVVTADFNSDGVLDLAAATSGSDSLAILFGLGDGTFVGPAPAPAGLGPNDLVAADFNNDGRIDLAAANRVSDDVTVALGNGDGTFAKAVRLLAGVHLSALVAADFDDDGNLDLAAGANDDTRARVYRGQGNGTFLALDPVVVGAGAHTLLTDDFNRDGLPDLVTGHLDTGKLVVHLGQGDGTFVDGDQVEAGWLPAGLASADFNRDGNPDLVSVLFGNSEAVVASGRDDGTFQAPMRMSLITGVRGVVQGDFNNDGLADLAYADPEAGVVTVQLALGNGTFRAPTEVEVEAPAALAVADFNHDGRADLAVTQYSLGRVRVLLGVGDGSFRYGSVSAVGSFPTGLRTADFNGDGRTDLVAVNTRSGDLSILLGRDDGTFLPQARQSVGAGAQPRGLVLGDFNGDDLLDLATTNPGSSDVSVLLSHGDGTFAAPRRTAVPAVPGAGAVAADFDGVGGLDLAVVHPGDDAVSVLFGLGDGTFRVGQLLAAGNRPTHLELLEVNGDGRPELGVVNNGSANITQLFNLGDGTFILNGWVELGPYPTAGVFGDFNGDGLLDAAMAHQAGVPITIALNVAPGVFEAAEGLPVPTAANPLLADLDGDSVPDVTVLRQDGAILFRAGNGDGAFDPPVVVNPQAEAAARDVTLVRSGGRVRLAAVDVRRGALAFYSWGGEHFELTLGPDIPDRLPGRLVAGDLDGDDLEDLVVTTAGEGRIFVYRQAADGSFGPARYELDGGTAPSAVALVDIDGRYGPDIVVTDRFSGDVRVLLNAPTKPFTASLRYHAGDGVYGMVDREGQDMLRARDVSASLVAADFDGDGAADLAVINSDARRFALLRNSGRGGLLNAVNPLAFATGAWPGAAATALVDDVDNIPDLVVLNEEEGTLSVFLGDGHGGFRAVPVRPVIGVQTVGLTLRDLDGDARLDVLVTNSLGDVLTLQGNGNGSFQPYRRADGRVALAVADLDDDGQDDFVFANETLDRVSVQFSGAKPEAEAEAASFVQSRDDGLLAPGAVAAADLNGDGLKELVVANSGGNTLLVYEGFGGGQFGPARSYFVGTAPSAVVVADVNADGLPDLVVTNTGSNDVTVLFGRPPAGEPVEEVPPPLGSEELLNPFLGGDDDASWGLALGPRLATGVGPVAAAVADVTGDGLVDVVVSNRGAQTVSVLRGLGSGFFDDRVPITLQAGGRPGPVFVGQFDSRPGIDIVAIDSTPNAGGLLLFSGLGAVRAVSTGGFHPIAATAADFDGDGLGDFVVAHHDAGLVTVLLGGTDGLRLAAALTRPDLGSLTDLVLGGYGGGTLEVYVAGEGGDTVGRLTFVLDLGPVLLPSLDATAGETPGTLAAEFRALTGSPFGVVATLLVGDGASLARAALASGGDDGDEADVGSDEVESDGEGDASTTVVVAEGEAGEASEPGEGGGDEGPEEPDGTGDENPEAAPENPEPGRPSALDEFLLDVDVPSLPSRLRRRPPEEAPADDLPSRDEPAAVEVVTEAVPEDEALPAADAERVPAASVGRWFGLLPALIACGLYRSPTRRPQAGRRKNKS